MPDNVCAEVKDKSTLARQGLQAFNTFIEPGWSGYLTLELVNNGRFDITLVRGMPIVNLVFDFIHNPCHPYDGKYQNQARGPVGPIMEKRK